MMLRQLLVMGTVATWAAACVTTSLWKATDPEEYVAISQNEVTESELRETGLRYHRDDGRGVYYVEKSGLRRLGDYTIRFFATPVTVVFDMAPTIVVIGAIAGLDHLAVESGGAGYTQHYRDQRIPDEPRATPVLYSRTMTPTAIGTPQ